METEVDLMEFGSTQLETILSAVTGVIDVSTIITLLATTIGVAAVFVLMWFGIRRGIRAIMSAVRSGRLSL